MELDESTDIFNFSPLLVYVRYIYKEEILEDFLCCQSLNGRTTGNDIFMLFNTFFENNKISWSMCKAICTDGVEALTGSKKDFRVKVNKISPNILFTHCMIHREALAAKKHEPFINEVLQNEFSIINFIKSKALNSRLFTIIGNEMGSDHTKLLLYTEVRWLSHELSKIALSTLLPFASTYLCETVFSALTIIKIKYRTKLNVESDLKVAVSNIKPNMKSIIAQVQAQVSH
ncbi:zinc finger BED domain-containing protein 5-like [Melanaphis sacchari]|uniref:zinc finger BED domain-containing protein 5-like n=1 Tax=Melanaphis sacchari TaxID=742174 RepID=UPI000DC12E11|nr:zinc finger BED domain-containing protein 5-like [Melanaphis sacchari]